MKYKKRRENDQEEDQNHIDEIRNDIGMRGDNWEKIQEKEGKRRRGRPRTIWTKL